MVLVAFAVFALGRWARPSYELQMRVGGRRLRVFAIDFISRGIRCDGVLTVDDASNQWLDALDDI